MHEKQWAAILLIAHQVIWVAGVVTVFNWVAKRI